jgi:hypothetical protein
MYVIDILFGCGLQSGDLRRHRVIPREFQIFSDPFELEYQAENGEERYKALGMTVQGAVSLDRETLDARLAASRVISIRLPESDLARARQQAATKILPYQTHIESLLHQALQREERRKAS